MNKSYQQLELEEESRYITALSTHMGIHRFMRLNLSQEEHDRVLAEVFKTLKERGLTLKRSKCKFNQKKLRLIGLVFSEKVVSPNGKKARALKKVNSQKTASELRSFLGFAQFSACFTADYATLKEPLRELLKKVVVWE